MMHIFWDNNGALIVSSLAPGVDPDEEAIRLKESGAIPSAATKISVNQALPEGFASRSWKWVNGSLSLDGDADKGRIWTNIKAERDHRIQTGGYKVDAKWYHSDTFSRTQQMGLVMLGANIPANTLWKTMDGSFVTMTQQLANQIFTAAAANDIAIFAAAEAHKTAMEASADPASYDFSGGWPPIFTQ